MFDDPDLEAAVDSALGLPAGHIVTKPELLTLTSLTVDSNVITSLKGLEFATNLQSLTLLPSDWNVTTPLASLTPIAGLTSLKSLALVRSGITNAQLATLGGLTNLKSLDLRYNAITSLTAISNFHALASLQIYGNAITDFSPLAGKVIDLDLPPVNADQAQNVTQLAAALYKSPIEILQYVTNNVANQFYTGSLKGPQATLETLAGNDWDQANLLKSLLDASGVFADTQHTSRERSKCQRRHCYLCLASTTRSRSANCSPRSACIRRFNARAPRRRPINSTTPGSKWKRPRAVRGSISIQPGNSATRSPALPTS